MKNTVDEMGAMKLIEKKYLTAKESRVFEGRRHRRVRSLESSKCGRDERCD